MASTAEFVIEKLTKEHDLSRFNCGNEALDLWLKRFAWTNVQNDAARVYVAHRRDRIVVGYHALTAGSVSRAEAPDRICLGHANHTLGAILLVHISISPPPPPIAS